MRDTPLRRRSPCGIFSMRCRTVFVIWSGAIAIPALIAALFVFGCCVRPFHGLLHSTFPICHAASEIAEHLGGMGDTTSGQPVPRPRPPLRTAPPTTVVVPEWLRAAPDRMTGAGPLVSSKADCRNLIAAGALRCDDDVGFSVLLSTFLI